MRRALAILGVVSVVAALVLLGVQSMRAAERRAATRVAIRGGEAGGLPLATPRDEHMQQVLLEQVAQDPGAQGLEVLMVMRHGHLVFERFGHGYSAQSEIDSGPFADALVALLAGVAAQHRVLPALSAASFDPEQLRAAIESGTHQRYADYLGSQLWSRLNGAGAWIGLPRPGAAVPVDCCFHARVLDWMRVAAVLLDEGRFEGSTIVPAAWVHHMRMPRGQRGVDGLGIELAGAAHGRQPFAASDVFFLRGAGHWRLWLVPGYKLGVLFGAEAQAGADAWDETRLPNLVIQAIDDAPTPQNAASRLQQLVPGH
jgi:hypothetical protein